MNVYTYDSTLSLHAHTHTYQYTCVCVHVCRICFRYLWVDESCLVLKLATTLNTLLMLLALPHSPLLNANHSHKSPSVSFLKLSLCMDYIFRDDHSFLVPLLNNSWSLLLKWFIFLSLVEFHTAACCYWQSHKTIVTRNYLWTQQELTAFVCFVFLLSFCCI